MYDVALVIGRHVREPFTEGGGKITYLIAKALSEIGISTYLIKVNYSLPGEKFYILKISINSSKKLYEWELRTSLLTQDDVLHKAHGMMTSNLVELMASPLAIIQLIKRLKTTNRKTLMFIGNSGRFASLLKHHFIKLTLGETTKVLAIYKRDEISKITTYLTKPKIVFTTSNELSLRVSKLFENKLEKIIFSYPPIFCSEISGTINVRKLPIILYMGRVSNQRFPLYTLKQIIVNLKKSSSDIILVIASPLESVSIEWLKLARELVFKLDAKNRVLFIFKTLNIREKDYLLTKASSFIFPGKGVVAVEPPLTVIEALAHGQYLITTGGCSTKELAYSGVGKVVENFDKLDFEECLAISNKLSYKISRWAHETFSFEKLKKSLRNID